MRREPFLKGCDALAQLVCVQLRRGLEHVVRLREVYARRCKLLEDERDLRPPEDKLQLGSGTGTGSLRRSSGEVDGHVV